MDVRYKKFRYGYGDSTVPKVKVNPVLVTGSGEGSSNIVKYILIVGAILIVAMFIHLSQEQNKRDKEVASR